MNRQPSNELERLLRFLDRLHQSKIHYRLAHIRDSIMVEIAVPGERWEVEFFADGHLEMERFRSDGTIENDDELLEQLIAEHADG